MIKMKMTSIIVIMIASADEKIITLSKMRVAMIIYLKTVLILICKQAMEINAHQKPWYTTLNVFIFLYPSSSPINAVLCMVKKFDGAQ